MAPILIADDDSAESFLVVRALQQAGVANRVVVVPDGDAAMAYLEGRGAYADRAAHPLPCLLLLDQKLPGCSGLDVLEWVRSRSTVPTLPVIVVSASTYDSDVQAAYLVGANGYVVKPASYEQTLEMAKAIKDYWLTVNRSPSPRQRC
jgi:CheY-like chemotaxis protein